MRGDVPGRRDRPPKPDIPPKPPRVIKQQSKVNRNVNEAVRLPVIISNEMIKKPAVVSTVPKQSTSLKEMADNKALDSVSADIKMIDEDSDKDVVKSTDVEKEPKLMTEDVKVRPAIPIIMVSKEPEVSNSDESTIKNSPSIPSSTEMKSTPKSSSKSRSSGKSTADARQKKKYQGRPYVKKSCPVAEGEMSGESSEYDDFCCMPTTKLAIVIKNAITDSSHQPTPDSRSFSSPAQAVAARENKAKDTVYVNTPLQRSKKPPPPRPKPPDLRRKVITNGLVKSSPTTDNTSENSADYKDIDFKKDEPTACVSPYEELNPSSHQYINVEDHPYEEVGAPSVENKTTNSSVNERQYVKIDVCSSEELQPIIPTGNISELESVCNDLESLQPESSVKGASERRDSETPDSLPCKAESLDALNINRDAPTELSEFSRRRNSNDNRAEPLSEQLNGDNSGKLRTDADFHQKFNSNSSKNNLLLLSGTDEVLDGNSLQLNDAIDTLPSTKDEPSDEKTKKNVYSKKCPPPKPKPPVVPRKKPESNKENTKPNLKEVVIYETKTEEYLYPSNPNDPVLLKIKSTAVETKPSTKPKPSPPMGCKMPKTANLGRPPPPPPPSPLPKPKCPAQSSQKDPVHLSPVLCAEDNPDSKSGCYSVHQAALSNALENSFAGSYKPLYPESHVLVAKKIPPARPPPPQPKRPPRVKKRAHTAAVTRDEVTAARKKFQVFRRSQSLSDADIAKRQWMAEKPVKPPIDIRLLYTKVNKDPETGSLVPLQSEPGLADKSKNSLPVENSAHESLENKMRFRPLPSPPVPPRGKRKSPTSVPVSWPMSQTLPNFSKERAELESKKLLEYVNTFPKMRPKHEECDNVADEKRSSTLSRKLRSLSDRTLSRSKANNSQDQKKSKSMFYVSPYSNSRRPRSSSIESSDVSSAYDSLYPKTRWYDDGNAADESNVSSHLASMEDGINVLPVSDYDESSKVKKMAASNQLERVANNDELDRKQKSKRAEKKKDGDTYCYEFQDKSETSDTESSIKIKIRIEKKTEKGGEEKVVVKRSVPVTELIRMDDVVELRESPLLRNKVKTELSGTSDTLSQISDIVSQEETYEPKFDRRNNNHSYDPMSDRRIFSPSISTTSDSWHTALDSSSESEDEADNKVRKDRAFLIVEEILNSERTYINVLKLLNEDFRDYIMGRKDEEDNPVISQSILNQILNYLPQIQKLNENFLLDLSNRITNWDDNPHVADMLVKIGPFFKIYSSYVRDFEMMNQIFDEECKKNAAFAQAVKDFEMMDRCHKLTIKHHMLKPVQRVPQYKLFLERYQKHIPIDNEEYNDAKTALSIVTKVALHINQSIKDGDNFNKMIQLQSSIVGNHEIIRPGRVFLKDGWLNKLSRKGEQPRKFVLLNDCLLYMSPLTQSNGLFKVNYNLPLNGLKVMIPTQEDYQNEFSIISIVRSFSLSASSHEERESWISAINEAIEKNVIRRGTYNTANLNLHASKSDSETASFVLGRQAPVWIPDARVTMCQICTNNFTVTFRRHHCRACGKVVCKNCSSNKAPLQYRQYHPERVCDQCYKHLIDEFTSSCIVANPLRNIRFGSPDTESDFTESESSSTTSGDPELVNAHRNAIKKQFRKTLFPSVQRIRNLPKVLKEVTANDQGSSMSGYLNHHKNKKSWKRSWFVVKDKVLYRYKASEDVAALESTPLLGYEVSIVNENMDGCEDNCVTFQLSHRGRPAMVFCTDNISAGEKWLSAMKEATVLS